MGKQLFSQKNSDKAFRFVIPGIMCILTLVSILTAVHVSLQRDDELFWKLIVFILALLFLPLLSFFLLRKKAELTKSFRIFMQFLLCIHLAASFTVLTYTIYLVKNRTALLMGFCTASYFFTMGIYVMLWLYQKQFLERSVLTRIVNVFVFGAFFVYTACLILNLFHPIFFSFTREGEVVEGVTDYISLIVSSFILIMLSIATLFSRLSKSRKYSFLCCIFIPYLFVILALNQDLVGGFYIWAVICLSILMPLNLIFFYAHNELEKDLIKKEKEETQLRISSMFSQMQPHFLYNSLAVIAALCEEDPPLAAKATNAFSDYLRENMNFADKSDPIPFSEELSHVKTYVWLEKLRFPNKLTVEYDIRCTLFQVPALTVQPMVENAIKHGICKNRAGGTVRIGSFETDLSYIVTISDDGIGFDTEEIIDDGRQHLGIKNTRYRIQKMMGGSLEIISTPQKGTAVTITLPKRSRI